MSEAGANLLCFGMGYTANALAASLDRGRWTVTGTFRDGDTNPSGDCNMAAFDGAEAALAAAGRRSQRVSNFEVSSSLTFLVFFCANRFSFFQFELW